MIENILNNPLVLLSIYGTACYVLTFFTRRIVETARPGLKKQADENSPNPTYLSVGARWWNGVVLYSLAPFWGVVLCFSLRDTSMFPSEFSAKGSLVFMSGITVGFTCSWFFKVFKRLLSRAADLEMSDFDNPPGTPQVPGAG